MENKITSTTYVPLQPPYQIIRYGKEVGMQIGTLIATTQKDDEGVAAFRIETHSYPVVTYRSKEEAPRDKYLEYTYFMEGAVWNRVELRDVITVCLSDSHLPWHEFIEFLWTVILQDGYCEPPFIYALPRLVDMGVKIDPIPVGKHTLHLETYRREDSIMVRTGRDDILVINTEYSENVEEMCSDIRHQIFSYDLCTAPLPPKPYVPKWRVKYATEEPDLKPLVKKLNLLYYSDIISDKYRSAAGLIED